MHFLLFESRSCAAGELPAVIRLLTMRSILALGLLLSLSACDDRDNALERQFALADAIGPLWDVAVAAQWYETQNGRWPTSIDQVADLDEVLGQVTSYPPEPVPVPDASAFNAIRFETVSDTLLRVHFDLVPFQSPQRGEVEIQDESGRSRMYALPAMTVADSRGVMEVPAYGKGTSDTRTRVSLTRATVRTQGGRVYEFEDEHQDLSPVIFLERVTPPQ